MDRFLEFFENREANYLSQNSDNYSMKRHSEYRICFLWQKSLWDRSKTISRRNDWNGSREVSKGMVIPCWEKKDCQSCNWWSYVQSYRLYYDLFEEIRRKRYFPLLFPVPPAPPLSTLPFPSSLSFFLAPTVCILSFYNFLFSLAARQIASRSMNFLERSCDCLSMFLLPLLFSSFFNFYTSFSSFLLESV